MGNRTTTRAVQGAARLVASSAAVAAALLLTACTAPAPQPTADALEASQPGPTTNVDPAVAATATAVESALNKLVAGNPKPDREAVLAALVAAGIPKANAEVSAGRTPTGLEVDAMEAGTLTGNSCVMGQIRDGGVVVTVLPVLASGKCFVGDSR